MITVSVAKDFTRYPSGRYRKHSRTSGEEFRTRFLEEPLRRGEEVVVDLDGTIGYGSSFLEEAFGGVARSLHMPGDQVLSLLKIKASDQTLIEEIAEYVKAAGLPSRSKA